MRQWQWIMRLLFGMRKMPLGIRLHRTVTRDRVMKFHVCDAVQATPRIARIEGWRYLLAARRTAFAA